MSDDPAYLAALLPVCDRFVAEMKAALGDPGQERAVVERALEHYRETRRAHGIVPDSEFQAHFFLSDPLMDEQGEWVRQAAIDELGLDAKERARINDLFLDVLGI